jgi:predicted DNA-binding transcriptional regulator AlpA
LSRPATTPAADIPADSRRPTMPHHPVERLALRLSEVAQALGISRRSLERERSAGRFPPPDLHIGKAPLWRPETLKSWVERGGGA